jgi:predicted nuclease with TOPRIM domain
MIVPESIRIELENLREENALLRESNARLLEMNTRLTAENELLRQKVDMLCRKVFGTSSEKIDLNQMLLFDAQEAKKPEGDGPELEVEPSPKNTRAKRISREATPCQPTFL